MTEKRFRLRLSQLGNGMITDTQKREDLFFEKEFLDVTLPKATEWLNELAEENKRLKSDLTHTKVLLNSMQDKYSGLLKLVHGFNGDDGID